MIDVTFFESPDVFAEVGRVSVFYVSERCRVVSVSSFKVVFCELDVFQKCCCMSLRVTVAWLQNTLLSMH